MNLPRVIDTGPLLIRNIFHRRHIYESSPSSKIAPVDGERGREARKTSPVYDRKEVRGSVSIPARHHVRPVAPPNRGGEERRTPYIINH